MKAVFRFILLSVVLFAVHGAATDLEITCHGLPWTISEVCQDLGGYCDGTLLPECATELKLEATPSQKDDNEDDDDEGFDWVTFLQYASIPILSAIIGWGTNVVALKMTFYPIEYFGIPGTEHIRILDTPIFGWQGIIPSKAEFMASLSVDLMTSKLIDVEEVFSRLDPARVAEELEPTLHRILATIISEVAMERAPSAWQALPMNVRNEMIEHAKRDAPEVIRAMMKEVKRNIRTVFDLKHMVIDALVRDKELMNQMFLKCGHDEFKFIEHSGIWIGLAFGLIQMGIWFFYQAIWLLPVCGFIGGYITNWVALKIIFEPVEPRNLCGYKLHGLFLKRQKEVARMYGGMVASHILNAHNILHAIISGPASDNLFEIIHKHVDHAVDEFSGITKPFVALTIGGDEYHKIKKQVADRIIQDLPQTLKYATKYTEEALDIENTLTEKLGALSSAEFERLLHPVFEQDEMKLIIIGGVLGMLVGFAQAYLINT